MTRSITALSCTRETPWDCREEESNHYFVESHHRKIPDDKQLWLAARERGGDGFVVLVRDPDRIHGVNVLTGVALSVLAESPLSQKGSRSVLLRGIHGRSGAWTLTNTDDTQRR